MISIRKKEEVRSQRAAEIPEWWAVVPDAERTKIDFIINEAAGPALAPNPPIMNGDILNEAGNNTLAHSALGTAKMT